MNLQSDIVELIKFYEEDEYELILKYIEQLEDEAVSDTNADNELLLKIEKLVMESMKE